MKFTPTRIPDVVVVEPRAFGDPRGYFMETWHRDKFAAAGLPKDFPQDNQSRSGKGTLRGLHYQLPPKAQGKLVRCVRGAIFDVAVDIRRSSPTFKQWVGAELSAENRLQLWLPAGFAHGFVTLSDEADVVYKCTDVYAPELERSIAWNDSELAVDWPVHEPFLSPRDAAAPRLADQPDLFE